MPWGQGHAVDQPLAYPTVRADTMGNCRGNTEPGVRHRHHGQASRHLHHLDGVSLPGYRSWEVSGEEGEGLRQEYPGYGVEADRQQALHTAAESVGPAGGQDLRWRGQCGQGVIDGHARSYLRVHDLNLALAGGVGEPGGGMGFRPGDSGTDCNNGQLGAGAWRARGHVAAR